MENGYDEFDAEQLAQDSSDQTEMLRAHSEKNRTLLPVLLQLGVSVLAVLAAVTIKLIGGSVYAQVGTWFYDNYNNSVFTDEMTELVPFRDEVKITEESGIFAKQTSNSDAGGKTELSPPLESLTVTSPYGKRESSDGSEMHSGIDLAAKENEAIYAAADGEVTIAQQDEGYGYYIVITHSDKLKTLYAHCSKLIAKKGDKVRAGDRIALAGQTGQAQGVHLHFEVIENGSTADPSKYLSFGDSGKNEA